MKLVDVNIEEFREKKAVVQKLKSMGLPTPKTEHYRYFGIKPLLEKEYTFSLPQKGKVEKGEVLEIVDGKVTKAPLGVFVEFLKSWSVDDSHYDQIYYLNHLFTPEVIHLEIEQDMELKVVQKFTQNRVFTPYRIKISVAAGVDLILKEEYLSLASESLYFYGFDIKLNKHSRVRLIQNRVNNIENFSQIGSHSVFCEEGSRFELYTFDFGEAKTLHNYHIVLNRRAECDANHIIFAKGNSKLGNTFQIEARGKEANISQLSRNVLKEKGRGIFDGLLIVKNPAKQSSLYQDSKTILLNDGAYMVSKPQMEIYTEFITQATHGSTTGHLDEEALFYLRQRGIAKEEAKEMLVLSFLEEVFQKLKDEEIYNEFKQLYEEQ